MRLSTSDTEQDSGPNLTPVIDIVFLLLIFFMVASRLNTQNEKEIKVDLPEVAKAQPLSMTPELVINVMDSGTYKISGKPYNYKQLTKIVETAKQNNPKQIAFIWGDKRTDWEYVAKAIGACNKVKMKCRAGTKEKSAG